MRNRAAMDRKKNKLLLIATAVLLCAFLSVQAVMVVRLVGKNRDAAKIEAEITKLAYDVENLENTIGAHHNLQDIEGKAKKLGMSKPDASQIRVLSIAGLESDADVRSAELPDAERTAN